MYAYLFVRIHVYTCQKYSSFVYSSGYEGHNSDPIVYSIDFVWYMICFLFVYLPIFCSKRVIIMTLLLSHCLNNT